MQSVPTTLPDTLSPANWPEIPPVASLISECLGAGTGCQWCVPFLKHLHAQHKRGEEPDLKVSPERYQNARLKFHATEERDPSVVDDA